MRYISKIGRTLLLLAILMFATGVANAQALSATGSVSLRLAVSESVTVAISPATVNFTGYNVSTGNASSDAPIVAVVNYNLAAGHNFIESGAWLGSVAQGLTNGSTNVSAANIYAAVNGGAAAPCTANLYPGFPSMVQGAGCTGAGAPDHIFGVNAPPAGVGSFTDTIVLSLQGATNLPAGIFTGTLIYTVTTG